MSSFFVSPRLPSTAIFHLLLQSYVVAAKVVEAFKGIGFQNILLKDIVSSRFRIKCFVSVLLNYL